MALLTLSQMAKQLQCSVRTFSGDIKRKQIPYILVGRSKRFDPDTVIAHLRTVDISHSLERSQTNRIPQVNKYAARLGW